MKTGGRVLLDGFLKGSFVGIQPPHLPDLVEGWSDIIYRGSENEPGLKYLQRSEFVNMIISMIYKSFQISKNSVFS